VIIHIFKCIGGDNHYLCNGVDFLISLWGMLKSINWKPYVVFIGILSLFSLLFDLKITLGIVLGSIVYFLNLFISSKKFPNLNDKNIAVAGALIAMVFEGILTVILGIGTYLIGGLKCFVSSFAFMIIPNIYFFIVGSKK